MNRMRRQERGMRCDEMGGGEGKGEMKWDRMGDLCEGEGNSIASSIPSAVSPKVVIFTVTGISFSPILCTNSITVPSSSITV